jgi:hypothetical protein
LIRNALALAALEPLATARLEIRAAAVHREADGGRRQGVVDALEATAGEVVGQQGPWASAGTAHISATAATLSARAQRRERVNMILSSVPVWWTIAACKLIQPADSNRVGLLTWRHFV